MSYNFVWDSTPDRIRKGTFLPVGHKMPGAFSGTDTEQLFNQSLLTQPLDWYYRNNSIEYKLNKHGYRTSEFDSVDWANSIVIFGCSNVYGTGIREEDTLSSQLSKITNMNVVNMGVGASSIEYAVFNSMILSAHYPTPKAVVQIYSSIDRTTYYDKKNVVHHGSWDMKIDNYFGLWSNDPAHAHVHSLMCQMISKQIWSNKTKYYETSFFDDTVNSLKLPSLTWCDVARDLKHPGRKTLYKLAAQIAANIKV